MDDLKNKRKVIKTQITMLKKETDGYATVTPDIGTLQTHQQRINRLETELGDNWNAVAILCKDDKEYDTHTPYYEDVIGKVCDIKAKILNTMATLNTNTPIPNPTSQPQPAASTGSTGSAVRLPTIELPSFSGDLKEWRTFHDLFKATIDSHPTLKPAQKLQYLKANLTGAAQGVLGSVQVIDANYAPAWKRLIDRYHNERELVFDTIKRLVNQTKIQSESASSLRQLVDVTRECIRSLEALQRRPDEWSDILVYLIIQKLDDNTRRSWELSLKDKKVPVFDDLVIFIEQQAHALGSIMITQDRSLSHGHKYNTRGSDDRSKTKSHHAATGSKKCPCCDGDHSTFKCETFQKMSTEDRRALVKKRSLCYNCLAMGHTVNNCKSGGCRVCNKKHHTTLHEAHKDTLSITKISALSSHYSTARVLLATVQLHVGDAFGKFLQCRAFLDSGSEGNFITSACAKRLNVKLQKVNIGISGLTSSEVATARNKVTIVITPHFHHDFKLIITALVLPQVTGTMPSKQIDISSWDHIQGLTLADPNLNVPSNVDLLLGAEVVADIVMENCCRGPEHLPIAQQSKLGWIVYGRAGEAGSQTVTSNHVTISLDDSVRKFWEIEEIPNYSIFTNEERYCLSYYAKTYRRTSQGRFVVYLPLRDKVQLGHSKSIALRRFTQLERKLEGQPEFKLQYHSVMREYLNLGHIIPVPDNELQLQESEVFYLPHHAVLKEASTSTKVRVVFDGSAKSTSGYSLNNCMMVGPVVQSDLFTILIRFRRWRIALTADIIKMYRQILISPSQTNLQRVLWRFNDSEPVGEYKSVTVTFGTASAPFLATQTLCQLANDEGSKFPMAAPVLLKDAYVDDIATGEVNVNRAVELYSQLDSITKCAGFELSKWVSNSGEVMSIIPEEVRGTQFPMNFSDDDSVKSLGLHWHPSIDCFQFTVTKFDFTQKLTKRLILSDTAKLFDPLGWLSPITIVPKMFLQELWRHDLSWDELLSETITQPWVFYREKLYAAQTIQIPRWALGQDAVNMQLHGFSDASEKAYAASIYLRSVSASGKVHIQLLTSKTRVAPLKVISLPRLELCGALLLAKLITAVCKVFDLKFDEVHAWCDSTITLDWIRAPSHHWKTFVGNRVSEIQSCTPQPIWHHVKGVENPADCASRGVPPEDLQSHKLWWNGPSFLQQNKFTTHQFLKPSEEALQELKKVKIEVHHCHMTEDFFGRYSQLNKLQRMVCWWVRFCKYLKTKTLIKTVLSVCELRFAMNRLVRLVQRREFHDEYQALQLGMPLPKKSKLITLHPFIDQHGCIRVGGRLQNSSNLPEERKHALILPGHHRLTKLLIRHLHETYLHAGPSLLLHLLQNRYWVLRAKNNVKYYVRKCVVCTRQRAETAKQLMGNLPASRVTPSRAFLHSGVDYAGPLMLRPMKGRSNKLFKCYIALFVCFSTRAIHLEAVSDMSASSFLAALHRFVSRRGLPSEIFSDCGSNFVGASRELKEFIKLTQSSDFNNPIAKSLSLQEIQWKFNPPSAPHMGGLWEAGIKSTKFHLRRVVGERSLNFEELSTLLCKIEACLNSRPLCASSSDIDSYDVLTPGHFLIHDSLVAVPEPCYSHLKENTMSRWQLIQHMSQQFWNRWSTEYLSRLQQRPKWASYQPNMEVGNLVLIKDERLPPQQWLLGRIIQVHAGTDGMVRVVTVKTKNGEMKRPITKLCSLPISNKD